jgi:hypothetical protein
MTSQLARRSASFDPWVPGPRPPIQVEFGYPIESRRRLRHRRQALTAVVMLLAAVCLAALHAVGWPA